MNAKIVIASTLKPITDPRALEKIGSTLAKTGLYNVHIIGSWAAVRSVPKHLTLHPHTYPKSLGSRLGNQISIYRKLRKLQPSVLIITTHELLLPAIFIRLFTRCKIIYDIQENYNFNLRHQHIYPWGLRTLLANYIRLKEYLTAPFITRFFLAEECYFDELHFIRKKHTLLLENKFVTSTHRPNKRQEKFEFLLSGTISELYGVQEALNFALAFPPTAFNLVIIGHCPNSQLRKELNRVQANHKNVTIKVSDQPVAHEEILAEIGPKTIGLLPYRINKSTKNKVPTKLYEYLGLDILFIISRNTKWETMIHSHDKALSIDFNQPVNIDQIRQFINSSKGSQIIDSELIMWYNYKNSLLELISSFY